MDGNGTIGGAGGRILEMLPGEKWWGLCNAFGREMPFTEKTELSLDLRRDNYAHQALSFLCSDKGRAIWCPEPVGVEIGGGMIRLECDKGEIELVEHAGSNLREAFRTASARWFPPAGGEPDLLYFSAPQCNTWIELTYNQNERDILAYARSMLDNGVPPGVFMIDDTWQFGYGTWEFDPRRFADPKGMMDALHAMGFKVLLWICPFVSMDSPAYRALLATGGFLAAGEDERGVRRDRWCNDPAAVKWWNGKSALLDFTHPDGRRWFEGELARLKRDFGADGFKFDGGGVHFYAGCVGTEGASPKTLAYDPSASPAAQSALYGEFALANPGSEYRNGFGFAGKPVIMRLHDKPHTWDALRRLIPDMLAAGFVGCPFICPDMIGGGEWTAFLPGSPFEPELFLRSAQVHALCPMMQISASPWRVLSPEHQKIFKDVVALRQRFAPRFVELAKESARTGEPMMRALEYVFPGEGFAEIRDEFMMGDDLLVAPVLEKGAASRRVVLPPGTWRADDGRVFDGPAEIDVDASLDRLPHFRRLV
ncbi:MAG: glycoside hydrolase [Kiritimatiellae bacterium]|nr:glycoside hydrolase [Kiritimatiellia bacterium]